MALFCGADPIFNYATQGDMVGHRPTNEFHKKNLFIIKHLLTLYHSDPVVRRIFWAWVHNIHVTELLGSELTGGGLPDGQLSSEVVA
jgi:hypothetical protein